MTAFVPPSSADLFQNSQNLPWFHLNAKRILGMLWLILTEKWPLLVVFCWLAEGVKFFIQISKSIIHNKKAYALPYGASSNFPLFQFFNDWLNGLCGVKDVSKEFQCNINARSKENNLSVLLHVCTLAFITRSVINDKWKSCLKKGGLVWAIKS